jgi:serine/threonine protein kinase
MAFWDCYGTARLFPSGVFTSEPTHSVQKALSWVHDACKGLDFLHSKGIMHGDVGCHNFLINGKQHLKLCDFAGSKREGETARICYEVRGQHPDYQSGQPTRVTELFALVSF